MPYLSHLSDSARRRVVTRLARSFSVDPVSGCYNWCGSRISIGNPAILYGARFVPVSRLAYLVWRGDIPRGFIVTRRCRNLQCFRPSHLSLVQPLRLAFDRVERQRARWERRVLPSI